MSTNSNNKNKSIWEEFKGLNVVALTRVHERFKGILVKVDREAIMLKHFDLYTIVPKKNIIALWTRVKLKENVPLAKPS